MEPKQNSEVFAQEIAELEAKLQQKKIQMEQAGKSAPEQHLFKEVVKEHAFAKESTGNFSPASAPSKAVNSPATATRTTTKEEEQQIAAHIATAFVKGIAAAVSEARKKNDPFLIDMLHDRLADEYYQKLLAARKIKAS